MAQIIFYEKPGCINNSRQKKWLQESGHTVIAKNLLSEDWSGKPGQLREFFAGLPIAEWFNRGAPLIKRSLIDPKTLDADQALTLMLVEPLLIRRPLMQVDRHKMAGFDEQRINDWIRLTAIAQPNDLATCPKTQRSVGTHG